MGLKLFDEPLAVINIGLSQFAEDLLAAGVKVMQVDWRPPAGGDTRLVRILALLDDDGEAPASVSAAAHAPPAGATTTKGSNRGKRRATGAGKKA